MATSVVKSMTIKDTIMAKNMRKVLELLQHDVLTFRDLRSICPRDDERAKLVALLLAGGMVEATFYGVPKEIING